MYSKYIYDNYKARFFSDIMTEDHLAAMSF